MEVSQVSERSTLRTEEMWADLISGLHPAESLDIVNAASISNQATSESVNMLAAEASLQDAKTARMLEIFANEQFDTLRSIQQMRLLMITWIVRNKIMGSLKRGMDLALCFFSFPIVLPTVLVTAIAIKLDSPGPVFFMQERVGKWGKPFKCYKFRSMFIDAEARKADLMHLNEADEIVFKIAKDPRVTRVGRIIRKLSIDEVPQLINVLKGDMSWVGPRPPVPYEVAKYKFDHMLRLNSMPGITGLQQVSGRSDVSFNRWIELDIQYIEEQSLMKDIEILIKTIPAVISGKGAY